MTFKVGDRVVIKSLDEMIGEYGEYGDGGAKTTCLFFKEMEYFCGKKATIKKIEINNRVDILFDENSINDFVDSECFVFDTQMIKPITSNPQEAEIEIKELVNKINNNLKKEKEN